MGCNHLFLCESFISSFPLKNLFFPRCIIHLLRKVGDSGNDLWMCFGFVFVFFFFTQSQKYSVRALSCITALWELQSLHKAFLQEFKAVLVSKKNEVLANSHLKSDSNTIKFMVFSLRSQGSKARYH